MLRKLCCLGLWVGLAGCDEPVYQPDAMFPDFSLPVADGGPTEDLSVGDGPLGSDGPATPGGTITTPPVCGRVGQEVTLTNGSGVKSFAFAWDTDHYLVVYSDEGSGAGDLRSMRISSNGEVIASPVLIEATAAASTLPSLLRTQTGWVVAWQEGESPAQSVRVHALTPDGSPVGSGLDIVVIDGMESRPILASSPAGVVVGWMDEVGAVGQVKLALLDENLAVQGAPVRLGNQTRSVSFPWLVGDGAKLAAIYSEDDGAGGLDVQFARLDTSLAPTSMSTLRNAVGEARLGRMIATPFGYLATWEDSRTGGNEIYMGLADSSGVVFNEALVEEPGTGDANWSNMASNGNGAIGVVYYQFRLATPQIFMSFVDHRGARVGGGADVQVSQTSQSARYPDVEWTGTEFGVAWVDTRSMTPQLFFAHVSCP